MQKIINKKTTLVALMLIIALSTVFVLTSCTTGTYYAFNPNTGELEKDGPSFKLGMFKKFTVKLSKDAEYSVKGKYKVTKKEVEYNNPFEDGKKLTKMTSVIKFDLDSVKFYKDGKEVTGTGATIAKAAYKVFLSTGAVVHDNILVTAVGALAKTKVKIENN